MDRINHNPKSLKLKKLDENLNIIITKMETMNRFKIAIDIVFVPPRHAMTEIITNSTTDNRSTKIY